MSKTKSVGRGSQITAHEAIQLLQSAVAYLQMAGLTVQAQNSQGGLQLTIPGAYYGTTIDGTAAEFRIGTPEIANVPRDAKARRTSNNGTPVPPIESRAENLAL